MPKFKLQFPEECILEIAGKWKTSIDEPMLELRPVVCERGWLNREDLKKVAGWLVCEDKRESAEKNVEGNSEEEVVAATAAALSSCDVYAQWEWLFWLDGVRGSVASAILHWFAKGNYPIASYYSLKSCGVAGKIESIADWVEYTQFCRDLATKHNITMRTLDRALRQYGEHGKG